MSALDECVRLAKNIGLSERYHWISPEDAIVACAELSQLRSDNAALREAVNEAHGKLSRMTDWAQYWLLAALQITGSNEAYILKDDVVATRAWLAAHPAEVKA